MTWVQLANRLTLGFIRGELIDKLCLKLLGYQRSNLNVFELELVDAKVANDFVALGYISYVLDVVDLTQIYFRIVESTFNLMKLRRHVMLRSFLIKLEKTTVLVYWAVGRLGRHGRKYFLSLILLG